MDDPSQNFNATPNITIFANSSINILPNLTIANLTVQNDTSSSSTVVAQANVTNLTEVASMVADNKTAVSNDTSGQKQKEIVDPSKDTNTNNS